MKKFSTLIVASLLLAMGIKAQNVFPASGRVGIYTATPNASLHVNGGAYFGFGPNGVNIDSATGILSFRGKAGYVVGNRFAFRVANAPDAGLFVNATKLRYEFRDTSGRSVFNIDGDASANVGIGTINPSAKLDVAGNINTSGGIYLKNGLAVKNDGFGRTEFFHSSTRLEHMEFNEHNTTFSNRPVYIVEKLGVGLDPGTEILIARFEVKGNIKITDGTQGAGKVLTSDANGLASWQAPTPLTESLQMAKDIEDLKQQVAELKAIIAVSGITPSGSNAQIVNLNSTASLQQNAPNPFSNSTVIKYNLPASVNNAQIIITDNRGTAIKTIMLTQKGNGQVTLSAGTLVAGSYFYTLVVDGKKTDTKQMQIVK